MKKFLSLFLSLILTLSFAVNTFANSSYMDSLLNGMGADTNSNSGEAEQTNTTNKDIITLTISKSGIEHKYALGNASSYTLPATHKEFVSTCPELITEGRVFDGYYCNGKKVTTITEDTTVTLKWRTLKTKFKKVKGKNWKVVFKFNKKDWKNVDGVIISYGRGISPKKYYTIEKKTNGLMPKNNEIVIKKKDARKLFKLGVGYSLNIEFYYNNGVNKVVYSGANKGTLVYSKNSK